MTNPYEQNPTSSEASPATPAPYASAPSSSDAQVTPYGVAPAPAYGKAPQVNQFTGKTRNAFLVWFWPLITFGIYHLYWYYKVNQELAQRDSRIQVSPGLAVLSLFVPIVGYVSIYNTGKRISQAQAYAGRPETTSGFLGFVLAFIGGFHSIYYQIELNNLWRQS